MSARACIHKPFAVGGLLMVGAMAGCSNEVALVSPPPPAPPLGSARALAFGPGPSNAFVGRPLIPVIQVVALDSGGNVAANFHGSVILELAANPNGATLTGTTNVDAANGIATFSDLSLNRAGAGYTLTASTIGLPSVTSAAFDIVAPGTGGIAFVMRAGFRGADEIYTINADGSGIVNLTNNSGTDRQPTWSPDGSKIAFMSDRDGNGEIYLMNADGSNQVNLTNNPSGDYWPIWSPDGSKIAFSSERDGNGEIYVMNSDGSSQVNLTNNPGIDEAPVWSPDGSKIAFASDRDGVWEIYVMNADGSNPVNLTNSPASDYLPVWSADGSKIAFVGAGDIYTMNADGSNPVKLTATGDVRGPIWSPDGQRIVYQNNDGIAVINADGTGFVRLIANSSTCGSSNPSDCPSRKWYQPAWSPSGSSIAVAWDSVGIRYVCGRDCIRTTVLIASGISVLTPDGSGVITLFATPGAYASYLAWSPR